MKKDNRAGNDHRKQWIDVQLRVEHPGDHGAQHDEFAVGDVQNPGDAVLQAQPHGNQGVNPAQYQAGDQNIQERNQHSDYPQTKLAWQGIRRMLEAVTFTLQAVRRVANRLGQPAFAS